MRCCRRSYAGRWITWFHHQWANWGGLAERLETTEPEQTLGFYNEGFTLEPFNNIYTADFGKKN